VKVHPEFLGAQNIPASLVTKHVWDERYESINDLERHLGRNGTVVRKFFLHVSKDEQKRRFLKRIEDQDRNWKFSSSDAAERGHWDAYQQAYQDVIRATATKQAPWYVIPADHKWFTRLAVAAAIVETLESLDLAYPTVTDAKRKELLKAKEMLKKD